MKEIQDMYDANAQIKAIQKREAAKRMFHDPEKKSQDAAGALQSGGDPYASMNPNYVAPKAAPTAPAKRKFKYPTKYDKPTRKRRTDGLYETEEEKKKRVAAFQGLSM